MITSYEQFDRRLREIRPFAKKVARPARGWIRAVRESLGMTTAQLGHRLGVKQPRISEMEKAEIHGAITLHSMERAAEALGCQFVYALVPIKPLTETVHTRAALLAEKQLVAIEQTMQLEKQTVTDTTYRKKARTQLIDELLRRPARLWDALP